MANVKYAVWSRVQTPHMICCLGVMLTCLISGCAPQKASDVRAHYLRRYKTLCDQKRFVEAAFEFEYGMSHTAYAYRKHPERNFIPARFPLGPILLPLGKPENIGTLVKVIGYVPPARDLHPHLCALLAERLGKPGSTPCKALLDYYYQNEGRLKWDSSSNVFRVDVRIPPGRKLPAGFGAIPEAGLSTDGYPLRIRCLKDGAEMCYVPPGRFCYRFSESERWVSVGRFYIDRLEVANAQYAKFCKAAGRSLPKFERRTIDSVEQLNGFDLPTLPVTCITWKDAHAYATWAGKSIPSEDEWFRAAFGDKKQPFPWGDMPPKAELDKYAVLGREWPETGGKPSPVGGRLLGASPFGVNDMVGNVREFLAGKTRKGSYEVVGGAYNDPWPTKIDWTSVTPTGVRGFFSEAKPWTGFRCVLVLSGTGAEVGE